MTLAFSEHNVKASSPSGDSNLEDKKENMSSFCGDSECLLDRMLEQCQTRVTTRHPGFGRKLVPYFTDDDDGSTETGIRQQPKGENCCHSRNGQKPTQAYKRSPRSSRRTNCTTSRRSRKAVEPNGVTFVRHHDNKTSSGVVVGGGSPTATTTSTVGSYEEHPSSTTTRLDTPVSICALFAGPICFNSPPPEALPMPTAVLLAKAMCLS
eukprot:g2033.t1